MQQTVENSGGLAGVPLFEVHAAVVGLRHLDPGHLGFLPVSAHLSNYFDVLAQIADGHIVVALYRVDLLGRAEHAEAVEAGQRQEQGPVHLNQIVHIDHGRCDIGPLL